MTARVYRFLLAIVILGLAGSLIVKSWDALAYFDDGTSGVEKHIVMKGPHYSNWDPDGVSHERPLLKKRWSWLPGREFVVNRELCHECLRDDHASHRPMVWIDTPQKVLAFRCRCDAVECE